MNLVDLADLASRCQGLRPAIHHRILDSECIKRRSGAHIALFERWNEPAADHGCTGSTGVRSGSNGMMREARERASAEKSTHDNAHYANRLPVHRTLHAAWLRRRTACRRLSRGPG